MLNNSFVARTLNFSDEEYRQIFDEVVPFSNLLFLHPDIDGGSSILVSDGSANKLRDVIYAEMTLLESRGQLPKGVTTLRNERSQPIFVTTRPVCDTVLISALERNRERF